MVAAGANPMDLKRGIDKAVSLVIESLKSQSQTVGSDSKKIQQVATISANNDDTIGKLIAEAFIKVGKEGVITVEEAKGTDTTVDVVEGMQFDRGHAPLSLPRKSLCWWRHFGHPGCRYILVLCFTWYRRR